MKILLFQDAFELCNPLGSSRGKFKVIGVYMILANLPPYLRSRINAIKLVLLVREKYVAQFGWHKVSQVLMKDLQKLETDGIDISLSEETINFKGTLAATMGDNLGCLQIGGFNQNFSTSQYFCRFCEKTLRDPGNNILVNRGIRTVASYNQCVAQAILSKTAVEGIRADSPLNALRYYQVCTPGLPPCLAHDLVKA